MAFLVQFGINLHGRGFQKAEIAWATLVITPWIVFHSVQLVLLIILVVTIVAIIFINRRYVFGEFEVTPKSFSYLIWEYLKPVGILKYYPRNPLNDALKMF